MNNTFKIIKEFPEYMVSPIGEIMSTKNGKKKILANRMCGDYISVCLYKNKKRHNKYVHRLVAETFLLKSEDKTQINHKDGDKLNNNIENLEWCNGSENIKHAYSAGLKTPPCAQTGKIGILHHGSKKINMINNDGIIIETFDSISSVNRKYGYCIPAISSCAREKSKSAYGYKWMFV